MTSGTEEVTASIVGEQGLSFKGGKLFGRRTIPGSAGLQTKELSWSVKDYDGSHLRPHDHVQAQRLVQRGKAIRDLQALLTSSSFAGAHAADILKAFHLLYWMLPIIERHRRSPATSTEALKVCDQICNKAGGQSLEGFSGCRARAVWGDLPPTIRRLVGHWLTGQYRRVKSGRTNEYQLSMQDTVDDKYSQQQQSAFACLQQLHEEIALLNASVQRVHLQPASMSQSSAHHAEPQQTTAPGSAGPLGSSILHNRTVPVPLSIAGLHPGAAGHTRPAASLATSQAALLPDRSAAGDAACRPAAALAALHVRAQTASLRPSVNASAQKVSQQAGVDASPVLPPSRSEQQPPQPAVDMQIDLTAGSNSHTHARDAPVPSSSVASHSRFLQKDLAQLGAATPADQAANQTSTTANTSGASVLGMPNTGALTHQDTVPASNNRSNTNGQQSSNGHTSAAAGHSRLPKPSSDPHNAATSSDDSRHASLLDLVPEGAERCRAAQGPSGPTTDTDTKSGAAAGKQLHRSVSTGAELKADGPVKKQLRRSVSTDDDQPVGKRGRLNPGIIPDSDVEEGEEAGAVETAPGQQRAQHAQHAQAKILELGRVYHGPGSHNFWSPDGSKIHHVVPLGYTAMRAVWNKSKRCTDWTLTVKLVDGKPYFEVFDKLGFNYKAPYMAPPTSEIVRQGLLDARSFGFEDDATQQALKKLLDEDQQEHGLEQAGSGRLATTPYLQSSQEIIHGSSQPSTLPPANQVGHPNSHHSQGLSQPSSLHMVDLSQPSAAPAVTAAVADQGETESGINQTLSGSSVHKAERSAASGLQADESPQHEEVRLQTGSEAQASLAAVPANTARAETPSAPESDIEGHIQSSTVQRIRGADVAAASVDDVQELILSLLPVLPKAASLDGVLNGWMAEMDINNDPSRQIRVKGLFRDLQFVLTRLPFAQADEAVHVMLQSLAKGCRRED